jgi:kynureninase
MAVQHLTTRDACVQADQRDPLREVKERFNLPENTLYLDGNSLGAMPKSALDHTEHIMTREWGQDLIRSWNVNSWFDRPLTIGNKLGELIGADEGTTVVTDTTSANLFKVLAAALKIQEEDNPGRRVIVAERDAFPTDLYIIRGLSDLLDQGYETRLIDEPHDLANALGEDVAAVVLSHVNYRTGYLWDLDETTAQVHSAGAMVIWDLCHSVGALGFHLGAAEADFAIGCTYKYLNGGPGSPAFLWVNPKHQNRFIQPLSGWWGHEDPFAMSPEYSPARGVKRFLSSTQPIVSLSLVEDGVDIFRTIDMTQLREKSLALTDLFIQLVETRLAEHPLTLITPREHSHRGSHVSYRHPHGYEVMQALIAENVIGDYREPEVLRFGITPLYFGYADVWDTVETLKRVLDQELWRNPQFQVRSAVT